MSSSRDAQNYLSSNVPCGLEQFYVKIGNCDLGSTIDASVLLHPDAGRWRPENVSPVRQFICKLIIKDGFILAELFQMWLTDDVDVNDVGSPDVCSISLLVVMPFPTWSKTEDLELGMVLPAYPNPEFTMNISSPHLSQSAVSHLPIHPAIQFSFLMYLKISYRHTKNWCIVPLNTVAFAPSTKAVFLGFLR